MSTATLIYFSILFALMGIGMCGTALFGMPWDSSVQPTINKFYKIAVIGTVTAAALFFVSMIVLILTMFL